MQMGGDNDAYATAAEIERIFGSFAGDFGQVLYDKEAASTVSSNLKLIFGSPVQITTVHESVLAQAPLEDQLAMLIASSVPSGAMVLQWGAEQPHGDLDQFEALLHNEAINNLKDFASSADLMSIGIPGVQNSSGQASDVEVSFAFLLMEVAACATDMATIASFLQKNLLVPMATPDASMDGDALTSALARATNCMQIFIKQLDSLINGAIAFDFERSGFKAPIPLSLFREWARLMAKWIGRVQSCLLKCQANFLSALTLDLKSTLPSWRACFTSDGTLNDTMAFKMLEGKMAPLVKSNNLVHKHMERMRISAELLAIVPKLSEHELTAQDIAVAMDSLRLARLSSTVIMGVDLIRCFRGDPRGPQRARDFLDKHRTKEAEESVPRGMWDELQHMAALSVVTNPSPAKSSAPPLQSSPRVKSEVAGSPSASASHEPDRDSDAGSSTRMPSTATSSVAGKRTLASPASGFKRAKMRPDH